MNQFGYRQAKMDESIAGESFFDKIAHVSGQAAVIGLTIGGYAAIRGRERQLYDAFKSTGAVMGNQRNPVWPFNPFAPTYWTASTIVFKGAIAPYTGALP